MSRNEKKSSTKRLVLISGVSGSGKSTALRALKDIGFFCVDNLPTAMLGDFADFLIRDEHWLGSSSTADNKFALLLDCRGNQDFTVVSQAIAKLETASIEVVIFFFDCQDDIIVRRFRETRRPHPSLIDGASNKTILEAVQNEREVLGSFRDIATRVFDTSGYSPHDLRRAVEDVLDYSHQLKVVIQSFGFKYGVPHDADLVMDVRFLPNPHFDPDLRPSTGHEDKIKHFVLDNPASKSFLTKYEDLLKFLIPLYKAEGKRYLTIAIGCTGGRHRSVAITRELEKRLATGEIKTIVRDRDIDKVG